MEYIGGIMRNLQAQLLRGNGASDHVHLAALVPVTIHFPEFVSKVKSNSSGWIHKNFHGLKDFGWQDGYSSFTVSPSVLPSVMRYIGNQAKHHKKMSFQDELRQLLKKHGIEFDERYMWS